MNSFAISIPGALVGLVVPALIFTVVATVIEARWGRRGLLVAWVVCVALAAIPLFSGNMGIEITGPISIDDHTDLHRMFAVAAMMGFVSACLAFAGSALALRALGASSPRPRSVPVRVVGGVLAGIGGGLVAMILSFVLPST